MREIGAAFIKLLGVYYAAVWVFDLAYFLTTFLIPARNAVFPEGGPQARDVLLASVLSLAALGIVAGVCLFEADAIAGRLFGEKQISLGTVSRRDVMFVGLSLVGAVTALDVAANVLEAAVKFVWYAEATRRHAMWEALDPPTRPLVPSLVTFGLGLLVVVYASRLTRFLDSRAG